MDLLADDITIILSLLAAVLGVVTGALPFLKKSNDATKGCNQKKDELLGLAGLQASQKNLWLA